MSISELRQIAVGKMEALAIAAESRNLTDDENAQLVDLKKEITELNERQRIIDAAAEARKAAGVTDEKLAQDQANLKEARNILEGAPAQKKVEVEARSPYAADADVSYIADLAIVQQRDARTPDAEFRAAKDRLEQYASSREARAYSAGTTTEGGYLVPPQYLQDMYAERLAQGRVMSRLMRSMPLPADGASFYIPKANGATAVAVHTENAAVTETSATYAQIQLDVKAQAGLATLPDFLLRRSNPVADSLVLDDLAMAYNSTLNAAVVNSATSNYLGVLQESGLGAVTATAGTAVWADYNTALLKAWKAVRDGKIGNPDGIVMTTRRWTFISSLLDSTGRPLVTAVNPFNGAAQSLGITTIGANDSLAPTGYWNGIPIYLDDDIPVNLGAGTDEDRIIVGRFSEALLFEGTPMFSTSREAKFGNDQVLMKVVGDNAFTFARRKPAFAIISGTALNDVL